MSIREKLDQDLRAAMRSGDTLRRDVIRLLRSAINYEEIAAQRTLDDDDVLRVLSKQAQQRRDSIEAFEQGNRKDLADREKAELAIIQEYLPQQLSREDVEAIVRKAIEETGAKGPQDMGKVMGKVMPQVRGRAEGREVNAIASEMLKRSDG